MAREREINRDEPIGPNYKPIRPNSNEGSRTTFNSPVSKAENTIFYILAAIPVGIIIAFLFNHC